MEVETSITGRKATMFLNRTSLFRGLPKEILTDSGSEFTCNAMNHWTYEKRVDHIFIDSGRPMQKGLRKALTADSAMSALTSIGSKQWPRPEKLLKAGGKSTMISDPIVP